MSPVQIGILGPLEIRADSGTRIEISGARLRALLICLALRPGQTESSARLIDSLWGDDPPGTAANALQGLVSRLRRALPDGVVESHQQGYRLAVSCEAVDAGRFERLVNLARAAAASEPQRAASAYAEAMALWRGPVLADVPQTANVHSTAARLNELWRSAVEELSALELAMDDVTPDVARVESLVAAHPTRERAVGLLMRALAVTGRPADALAVYERLRTTLAAEFGVDPSPDVAELHLRILRGELEARGPEPERRPHTNIRTTRTSFVGRDDDVVRVSKLIGEYRLTTLTGPGGSGKTRLALESARSIVDRMPDGVWFVELATLSDAAELTQAILTALGLRDPALPSHVRARKPDRKALNAPPDDLDRRLGAVPGSIERLLNALADKQLLLVLDNCEHLVDDVAVLVDRLLGQCEEVRVLATSREPLDTAGEALWPVEPLVLPPADASATEATSYASVRLFADRAAAAYPGFAVTDETAAAIVRICRALDGMPLAIELAAARLRTMTPRQVADRLDDRFELLASGSRTALRRHKTLRAVVDWSWDLLDDAEQRMLRRLAYFAGGATLESAACIVSAEDPVAGDVLGTLMSLTDKSLLVLERLDRPRYRMLETIKAYGMERLAEAGETKLVRHAHSAHFRDLVEAAEPHLRGDEQLYWLDRLDDDYDNVQAALRAAIATGDAPAALRTVAGLGYYWNLRAKRAEALELVTEALEVPGQVPDELRALALANGWICGAWAADNRRTERWIHAAVELADRSQTDHPMLRLVRPASAMVRAWIEGTAWTVPDEIVTDPDPWVRGFAYIMRAHSFFQTGEQHEQARADLESAVAVFREAGDRSGTVMALGELGSTVARAGEFGRAVAHIEEALELATSLQSVEDITHLRTASARLWWLLNDRERARAELEEAKQLARRSGLAGLKAAIAAAEVEMARLEGDIGAARAHLDEADNVVADLDPGSECCLPLVSQRGYVDASLGEFSSARAQHARAYETAASSGDALAAAHALVGIADLALASGHPERAAAILSASVATRGAPDRSVADADRIEKAVREALGDQAFNEAYERGRRFSGIHAAGELVAGTLAPS